MQRLIRALLEVSKFHVAVFHKKTMFFRYMDKEYIWRIRHQYQFRSLVPASIGQFDVKT